MKNINRTINIKHGGFTNPRRQSGYILIVTVILLGAMLLATLNYFQNSTDSIQISGFNKDSAEALLLAESAANTLYAQFKYNGDLDNDGVLDHNQTFDDSTPDLLPLFYMYYRSDNSTINATSPSILQMIADGEARITSRGTTNVTGNRVPATAANLIVNEMSSNGNRRPVVYVINNNQLVISNDDWASAIATNNRAAVAWLELTRVSATNNSIQVYAQAVAKVGNAKNYVQRYVGVFPDSLGPLPTTSESD
ncbi:MAG: hypothetical protein OEX07_06510 [Gammaproteobacteria bacterium]|nr:hypothetical protein [Gammaproteobacteria bacterium]